MQQRARSIKTGASISSSAIYGRSQIINIPNLTTSLTPISVSVSGNIPTSPPTSGFKIGDKVIINPNGRYPDQGGGTEGVVTEFNPSLSDNPYMVKWGNGIVLDYGDQDLLLKGATMQFKKGDKATVNIPSGHPTQGQVVTVTSQSGTTVYTMLDPAFVKPRGSYYGNAHNGMGQAYSVNYLVPITAKPRPKIKFESVVIEDEKRNQILEAIEQINQQGLIFDTWGFGETMEKGKGVSMLFYGPPGTGKTLMAQAIGDKLDRKLKVISTADIESSVPGEAERNIRKYFKEAADEAANSILLFDECDSLIYSRSSVGAILGAQINELLSQLERFEGITIFTTNRLGTLDEAVNRRLALKLEFNMPSREQRVEIWKRMFPKKAPLDDNIDWNRLAGVELTGGYIKNAVLRAARMAAAQEGKKKDKKITEQHLVTALRLEAESMLEFEKHSEAHKRRGFGTITVDNKGHTHAGFGNH